MNLKPGYLTSEFYVTLLTTLAPYVALVFHKSLGGQTIQDFAEVASALATVVYVSWRTVLKKTHVVKAADNPDPVV